MPPRPIDFYTPVPTEPLPNDDLDLQLMSLEHLLKVRPRRLSTETLLQAWEEHMAFPFDEYAICLRNLKLGLRGAAVGATDNWFADSMGAAIRSELWACLAPCDPAKAAAYARIDACCDHAGEGVWAAVFFSALQSAAFGGGEPDLLIDSALTFVPQESRVARCVSLVRESWSKTGDEHVVRNQIVKIFDTGNFTDVAVNVAITILAWLAGRGDFGKSLCTAVNCGYDTDCTAATLGALLGILDPDGIPCRWSDPVGETVVLSPEIRGVCAPKDVDSLTGRTLELQSALSSTPMDLPKVVPRTTGLLRGLHLEWSQSGNGSAMGYGDSMSSLRPANVPGHWFHLSDLPGLKLGLPLHLRFRFSITEDAEVLPMFYNNSDVRISIDGEELFQASPTDWQPGWHAPSFHRFRRHAMVPTAQLEVGVHRMDVLLENTSPQSNDAVVGIGDGCSDQWMPSAMVSP